MTYTLELYLEKCADSNDERPYQGFAEDIGYDIYVSCTNVWRMPWGYLLE